MISEQRLDRCQNRLLMKKVSRADKAKLDQTTHTGSQRSTQTQELDLEGGSMSHAATGDRQDIIVSVHVHTADNTHD